MARVLIENVDKVYPGNVHAVRGISLEIKDKEFLVMVGPSGCGKTTTLRMIAGLEDITGGEIKISDRVVNNVPPKDRDIAMVFQNYALYPHMTVRHNMSFGLKLRRYPRAEIKERVAEAAKILSIEEYLDRKPKELSGGQRQRVAVGRAIVRKPQAFLFDEPLSNLDAKLRVQMRIELSRLHKRLQTTMIYVTHDQVEAMTLGDRIVVMHNGVIMQADSPLQVYDYPANRFVAGFIGTPPMNFFKGRLVSNDGVVLFEEGIVSGDSFEPGRGTLSISDEVKAKVDGHVGKPVTLGIRPEHVYDRAYQRETQPGTVMKATVEAIEPLGDEQHVYLSTGQSNLVSKVDAHHKVEMGQEVDIVVDPGRMQIFAEGDEGVNLTLPSSG